MILRRRLTRQITPLSLGPIGTNFTFYRQILQKFFLKHKVFLVLSCELVLLPLHQVNSFLSLESETQVPFDKTHFSLSRCIGYLIYNFMTFKIIVVYLLYFEVLNIIGVIKTNIILWGNFIFLFTTNLHILRKPDSYFLPQGVLSHFLVRPL